MSTLGDKTHTGCIRGITALNGAKTRQRLLLHCSGVVRRGDPRLSRMIELEGEPPLCSRLPLARAHVGNGQLDEARLVARRLMLFDGASRRSFL